MVTELIDVGLEDIEVLHPPIPAEVLIQTEHVEIVVGELLGEARAPLDVNGDRQGRIDVASVLLRLEGGSAWSRGSCRA